MKKKWISLLTAFALLLGVFCFMPTDKVLADETWTDWTDATSFPCPTGEVTSANYILQTDVEITSEKILSGVTIKIDLNGHYIKLSDPEANVRLCFLKDQSSLTISDSGSDGYIMGKQVVPSGNKDQGGIFFVDQGCTLTLDSGTFKDSICEDGGAVHIVSGGYFYMNGGTISGCKCLTGGGGVHSKGTFIMTGGLITDCHSDNGGGGFQVRAGTTKMSGGMVTGCSAKIAGGGVRIFSNSTLELSGDAKIVGNQCKHSGLVSGGNNNGNLSAGAGIFMVSGGNIKIKGNVEITGNDSDYAPGDPRDNLYLADNNNCKITIVGSLGDNAKIGVSVPPAHLGKVLTSGLNNYGTTAAFISDNSEYEITTNSNGEAIFSKIETMYIKNCNVSSDGDIKLNVYLGIGESYQSDAQASYSYSYTVTKNGQNKTENKSGSFTFDQMTEVDGFYKFSIPVESACMTAPIEITATSGDLSITKTITIEKYANAIINGKDYTASQKAAAEALIKYGGYAQVQFSINANKLPQGYDFTAEPSSSLTSEEFTKPDTLYGASVVFLTQNNIKFYFTEDVGTVTVNGNAIDGPFQSGNYYVYEYKGADGNGIPAGDFDASYTVVAGSTSFDYSIYTYLKAIYASKGSGSMVNLAKAYYNFATAIKAL
ncbi:MAG: hypothetical protein K6G47_05860 [Clostridia bacterium]|nr:hypothetical protein [Clostridia bacterium]